MSQQRYHLEFHAVASSQIPGLPAPAYTAMVEVLLPVIRAPWATTFPNDPESQPTTVWRWVPFGDWGLLALHIDESRRTIRVHDITWIG